MEKLAIDGGPRTIEEALPREWPGIHWIGDEERQAVQEMLKPGSDHRVDLVGDLKVFYGCPTADLMASGTSALFVAAASLGIKPGMEVLIPGFCWVPTFGCIVACGAIPVLVDVGEDLGMDPVDMERKITPRTTAAVVVHMCGGAANMDGIMDVVKRHRLILIEDCAQHGAGKFKGQYVGLFGDVGCFSLQQNKHFTSFYGGYAISRHEKMGHTMNLARDAGMSRVNNVVSHKVDEEVCWGAGTPLNPLPAAMARAQLKKVPRIIASMQKSQRRIIAGIGLIPGLRFRPLPDPAGDCGSFLVTYWPDAGKAARAAAALKAEGVPQWIFHLQDYGCHMYYNVRPLVEKVGSTRGGPCPWECPHNAGSNYSYAKGALPKSDEIFSRGVVMAVPSVLTDDQCDRIAAAYRKVAGHVIA